MSFTAVLIAPLVLLPAAVASLAPAASEDLTVEIARDAGVQPARMDAVEAPDHAFERTVFQAMAESFRVQPAGQVRIEQHTTIRIVPRPIPVPPNVLMEPPRRPSAVPRVTERNIGRCLPAARIGGVQVEGGNRLILFLRDRRMISAELERSCRARDFYSGFYVEQSADGQLCAGRDTLLSRNGANCKLTRIREIVDPDD